MNERFNMSDIPFYNERCAGCRHIRNIHVGTKYSASSEAVGSACSDTSNRVHCTCAEFQEPEDGTVRKLERQRERQKLIFAVQRRVLRLLDGCVDASGVLNLAMILRDRDKMSKEILQLRQLYHQEKVE